MATKCQKAKERIRLSSEKEGNYKFGTGDKTNLDKANNNKYLLQL